MYELKIFNNHKINLVIIDFGTPKMNGFELLKNYKII